MRRTRSEVISTLIAVVLVGSSMAVAAQEEPEPPGADAASFVAGEVIWIAASGFEDETQSDGILRQRGRELIGSTDMSDARLSGEFTMRYDSDVFVGGGYSDILWGSVDIVNGEGVWDGRLVGTSDTTTSSGEGSTYFELVGSGGYEGLSAVLFMPEGTDPETGESVYPLSGVIYPGELPLDRPGSTAAASPEATSPPTPAPSASARPDAATAAPPEASPVPTPAPSAATATPAPGEEEAAGLAGVLSRIGPEGEVPVDVALDAFAATIGPIPGFEGVSPELDPFAGSEAARWLLRNWGELTDEQRAAADRYFQPPTGGEPVGATTGSNGTGMLATAMLMPLMATAAADDLQPCHMDPELDSVVGSIIEQITLEMQSFWRVLPVTPCIVDPQRYGDSARVLALNREHGYLDGKAESCWLLLPEPLVETPEFQLHRREILGYLTFGCYQARAASDLAVFNAYPSWILGGTARWVGAKVADGPPVRDGSWLSWVRTPTRPLFSRHVDAVGFWELLNKAGSQTTWRVLEQVVTPDLLFGEPRGLREVSEAVYGDIMDMAGDPEVLDFWGPSYFDGKIPSWSLDRPQPLLGLPPIDFGEGPTFDEVTIENGLSLELRAEPISASATAVELAADVVVIGMPEGFLANVYAGSASVVRVEGRGLQSVGNATFEFALEALAEGEVPEASEVYGLVMLPDETELTLAGLGPASLCTLAVGCTCPSGSPGSSRPLLNTGPGVAHLGLTGHYRGTEMLLSGYSLEDFCASPPSRDPDRYVLVGGEFQWIDVGGIDNSGCEWPKAETSGKLTIDPPGGFTTDYLEIDASQHPFLYRISLTEDVISAPVVVPECRVASGQRKWKAGEHQYASPVQWISYGSEVPSPGSLHGFEGSRTWNHGQNIESWNVWPVDGPYGQGEDGP